MVVDFDPVALDFVFLQVQWYGLAYLVGFLGALFWAKYHLKRLSEEHRKGIQEETLDEMMSYMIVGVIVGGRLGEVLFYHPHYYWANPLDVVKIWEGGMSFHGGVVGVVTALWYFSFRKSLPFKLLGDLVCLGLPIGLFFGRITNFINGELWGRVTDVSWGWIFPRSGTGDIRHPSPLYEAALEGFVLFFVLAILARKGVLQRPGVLSGYFLLGYGIARIISEHFRQPEVLQEFLISGTSWGQWLSVPMVLVGGYLIYQGRASKNVKL